MCNNGILSAVAICIGKLATIVLKTPIKRLTQKDTEIIEEKKKKLKEKKNSKKEKKLKFSGRSDEEYDDVTEFSTDSDDDVIDDKEKPHEFSQSSQSSQSSQLFDESELAEVINDFIYYDYRNKTSILCKIETLSLIFELQYEFQVETRSNFPLLF